jgi:ribosomal protein S18 acetylase RimI-like enzyme
MISSTPIFAASDIEATITYYKDVLGFESSWTWGEPPTFGSVSLGGVTIMFNLLPELAAKVRGHQHWIKVDEVDEMYRLHRERGATVVSEIDNKPWGAREYIVEDLHGYHLRFAGAPSTEAPKSQPFPHDVTLERRKPSAEEFETVAAQSFGYEKAANELLGATWGGVVARAPGGEAIGVLRIMHDAQGWFSIWDVAVLPEWQARRIGSALMREALAMIREESPGAIVFLFTYKHGFYERLGFGKESVSLIRL